jgi:hypothetical protein
MSEPGPGCPMWDGEERRSFRREDIADMVAEELDSIMADTQSAIIRHIDAKTGQLHLAIKADIDAAIAKHEEKAYPDGVPLHKHKEYHASKEESSQNFKRLKQDLAGWMVKGVVGTVILLLGMGAMTWLQGQLAR